MEILPLISFLTGVISILSPCILPIIPIFVALSLKSKTKGEIISFTLGLLSIFIAVIILTGFFTSLVYAYIPYVRIISALLLLIIGIVMLSGHTFHFGALSPQLDGGVASSFALGFLTSVSWAPCYSGYLMSLIALLMGFESPLYASLNIFLYSLGFALALFSLSYLISRINLENFISKTKYLPRLFSCMILIGALYLLWEALKVLL